jgi:hypothetical protein
LRATCDKSVIFYEEISKIVACGERRLPESPSILLGGIESQSPKNLTPFSEDSFLKSARELFEKAST